MDMGVVKTVVALVILSGLASLVVHISMVRVAEWIRQRRGLTDQGFTDLAFLVPIVSYVLTFSLAFAALGA
jgi:hypothetical protein